jgi:hypothetical protein
MKEKYGRGMWYIWGRKETYTFPLKNLNGRENLRDLNVDERILKHDIEIRFDVVEWIQLAQDTAIGGLLSTLINIGVT